MKLSSYIVTKQLDIDFLLNMFGKYSTIEHDGGLSTIAQFPNKTSIEQDITEFSNYKDAFKLKLKTWKDFNNYNQQSII